MCSYCFTFTLVDAFFVFVPAVGTGFVGLNLSFGNFATKFQIQKLV